MAPNAPSSGHVAAPEPLRTRLVRRILGGLVGAIVGASVVASVVASNDREPSDTSGKSAEELEACNCQGGTSVPHASPSLPRVQDLVASVAAFASLLGGAIYFIVAYGYDSFYFRLGLAPGDVELGYDDMLRSAFPAIALALTIMLVPGALLALCVVFGRKLPIKRTARAALLLSLITAFLAMGAGAIVGCAARQAADQVKKGNEAESIKVHNFTLVRLETRRVAVSWVGLAAAPSHLKPTYLFLGNNSSQVLMYDCETRQGIVSVPAISVVLTRSHARAPRACTKMKP
jgi:hypothetical protein